MKEYTEVYMTEEEHNKMFFQGETVKGSLIYKEGYKKIVPGNERIIELEYPNVLVKPIEEWERLNVERNF